MTSDESAPSRTPEPGIKLPDQIAEWELEPELTLPPPRTVALKEKNFTGMTLAFLILLILAMAALSFRGGGLSGSLLVVIGTSFIIMLAGLGRWWECRVSKSLVERGTATRGVVIESVYSVVEDVSQVTVAYDTTEGRRLIRYIKDTTFVRGDTITILYLPEAPKRAKPYRECAHRALIRGGQTPL